MEDTLIIERINQVKRLDNAYFNYSSVSIVAIKTIQAYKDWVDACIRLLSDYYPKNNEILKSLIDENSFGSGSEMYNLYSRNRNIISSMLSDIESGRVKPLSVNPKPNQTIESGTPKPLVFISHASKDEKIIRKFMDYILKNGLGLSNDNIVCTSFEWTTASLGDNIPEYIHDKIEKSDAVLAMVSQEYKKSEVCQNEVGAAWALGKRIISIVLPDADFKQLGWLFNLDKAAKINDENSLNLLQKNLCDHLKLESKKPLDWRACVSPFLEDIKNLIPTNTNTPNSNSSSDKNEGRTLESLKHDKQLFETFDKEFYEDRINYSLHGISHTTKYSDYDLHIWLGIIEWFKKISNSFLDDDLQKAAQKFLDSVNSLVMFTGQYYSTDRYNWSTENDQNVSQEKWREIHEAKIFNWEPDYFYDEKWKLEQFITSEVCKNTTNVENAYKEFRLLIKTKLFI